MTRPRVLRLGRFPEKEMLAIPEREQRDVIHDFLARLNREDGDVIIPRTLAVEITRLLKRVKREGRGKPPKTQRERSWDEDAVWSAGNLRQQYINQGLSKDAAKWRAASEVAATDNRPGGLSAAAIVEALDRPARRLK